MNAFFLVAVAWLLAVVKALEGSFTHALEWALLGALVLAAGWWLAGMRALKKRDEAEAERDAKPERVEHDLTPDTKRFMSELFANLKPRAETAEGDYED